MSCIDCARGFHTECGEPCCCSEVQSISLTEEVPKSVGRPTKPDEEITVSAGRKRAAELYKDQMGLEFACDWVGLSNCGGGFNPIIGCLRGRRTDIHHGPDKRTFNNERSNVSLICSLCHNSWHAANDPAYGQDKCPIGIQPMRPRLMDDTEFTIAFANESKRKSQSNHRPKAESDGPQ